MNPMCKEVKIKNMDPKIIQLIAFFGVGLALFIFGLMSTVFKKKGAAKFVVLIAGIGLMVFSVPGIGHIWEWWDLGESSQYFLAASSSTTYVPTGGQPPYIPPTTAACSYDGNTVTFSSVDAYSGSASGGVHAWKRSGSSVVNYVSDAGTASLTPYETITILLGNESDTGYYAEKFNFQVPCAASSELKLNGDSPHTYRNGTLTVRIFNEEGNIVDGNGENETLTAGDTPNLKLEVQGQYQRGFPHGFLLVVEYNKSSFDNIVPSFNEFSIGPAVTVPTVHTISSTGRTAKAYELPAMISNTMWTGTLAVDVGDDTTDTVSDTDDPIIYFYAKDYFIDSDNGNAFAGPSIEDEDNTQTFFHTTSSTLSVD